MNAERRKRPQRKAETPSLPVGFGPMNQTVIGADEQLHAKAPDDVDDSLEEPLLDWPESAGGQDKWLDKRRAPSVEQDGD